MIDITIQNIIDSGNSVLVDVKMIPLTRGMLALVDADDYDWLAKWKWNCLKVGYASRSMHIDKKKKLILMHRLITNAPKGMEVDQW